MSKKESIKVTVLCAALAMALGVKTGATVDVETRQGVPVSKFWRNRFTDAPIDKAIEVANNTPKRKPLKAPEVNTDDAS